MGKAARLKKQKKERELMEQKRMENFIVSINKDVDYMMTIKSEFMLRAYLSQFPEKIQTLFADVILDRIDEVSRPVIEERLAKGERIIAKERYGHLLDGSGYTREQYLGWRRRKTFYESLMNGGVDPANHEETYKKPGYMLPYLYSIDWIHWGRWEYWIDVMHKGKIEQSGPIPQITWCHDRSIIRTVQAMISDCLNYGQRYECTLDDFADWILWGFNAAPKHPEIPPEVNEYWLRAFDYGVMIRYPHDYLTPLLIEWYANNVDEEREVSLQMLDLRDLERKVEIEFNGKNPEELKKLEIYEDEVGCGTMLLPYSNYTFFAGGGVEDPLAMKLNKINMLLYAPWYAHNPFRDKSLKRWSPMTITELLVAMLMAGNEDYDEPRLITIG